MSWLSRLFGKASKSVRSAPPRRRCQPELETLEERAQPSVSSIVSNFNGTKIPAGDNVWFNSVMKVSGLGSSPVTLTVDHAEVDFSANGTSYSVPVPDARITFTPGATSASTAFDASNGTYGTWETSVPSNLGGNVFLAGLDLPVPGGLPGGINPVTWTADFHTDTAGVTVNWQWAAAVYTQFSSDYTAVGVKPVDSNQLSVYQNSDHAGTPEAFRTFVTGGTRGGGGSNFTGSYSATGSVTPDTQTVGTTASVAATASLAGSVTDETGAGVSMVVITLRDGNGNVLGTATTDRYGNYSFSNVPAGSNDSLTEGALPAGDYAVGAFPGTVGNVIDGASDSPTVIYGINLNGGDVGVNYNFTVFNPNDFS